MDTVLTQQSTHSKQVEDHSARITALETDRANAKDNRGLWLSIVSIIIAGGSGLITWFR